MMNMRPLGLVAATLSFVCLLTPGVAKAQRTSQAAGRPLIQVRPARTVTVNSNAHRIQSRSQPKSNFDARTSTFSSLSGGLSASLQDLLNPVPGLGFDYQHLTAMNRDLGIKAVIDPETEWRIAVAERLLRTRKSSFAGPGYFILADGGGYVVPVEPSDSIPPPQQPQIIVVQQAPTTPQEDKPLASEPAPETLAPLPDAGEFTLVLHNGTQIKAVAFTLVKDKIVYITAEGSRRTLAVADLDSEATVDLNEERGMPLQFPL